MDGQSVISPDVVARYAADAAREVEGVAQVSRVPRRGMRADGDHVGLMLVIGRGFVIPDVAAEVQRRVADYLERMTGRRPEGVDVHVSAVDAR